MKLIVLILGVLTLVATAGCESGHEGYRNSGGYGYGDERGTAYGQGYQTYPNPEYEQKYEDHKWHR